jgi:type III secretion protein N (ATPase)
MTQIVPREHVAMASALRSLMAKYDEVEMLLQVGEYKAGNDPHADAAVERIEGIRAFLNQATTDLRPFEDTLAQLSSLVH